MLMLVCEEKVIDGDRYCYSRFMEGVLKSIFARLVHVRTVQYC
jgi:hypothetical protein